MWCLHLVQYALNRYIAPDPRANAVVPRCSLPWIDYSDAVEQIPYLASILCDVGSFSRTSSSIFLPHDAVW